MSNLYRKKEEVRERPSHLRGEREKNREENDCICQETIANVKGRKYGSKKARREEHKLMTSCGGSWNPDGGFVCREPGLVSSTSLWHLIGTLLS